MRLRIITLLIVLMSGSVPDCSMAQENPFEMIEGLELCDIALTGCLAVVAKQDEIIGKKNEIIKSYKDVTENLQQRLINYKKDEKYKWIFLGTGIFLGGYLGFKLGDRR